MLCKPCCLVCGRFVTRSGIFCSNEKVEKTVETVKLYPGENPNLGLDTHGNIYLNSDTHFPVLMGNWIYENSDGDEVQINDPVTIIFE